MIGGPWALLFQVHGQPSGQRRVEDCRADRLDPVPGFTVFGGRFESQKI
jgi:hypothetical protein